MVSTRGHSAGAMPSSAADIFCTVVCGDDKLIAPALMATKPAVCALLAAVAGTGTSSSTWTCSPAGSTSQSGSQATSRSASGHLEPVSSAEASSSASLLASADYGHLMQQGYSISSLPPATDHSRRAGSSKRPSTATEESSKDYVQHEAQWPPRHTYDQEDLVSNDLSQQHEEPRVGLKRQPGQRPQTVGLPAAVRAPSRAVSFVVQQLLARLTAPVQQQQAQPVQSHYLDISEGSSTAAVKDMCLLEATQPQVVVLGCCDVSVFQQELRARILYMWQRLVMDGTIPVASCFLVVGRRWVPMCVDDLASVLDTAQLQELLPRLAEAAWRTLSAQDAGQVGVAPPSPVIQQVLSWCRELHSDVHGLDATVVASRKLRSTPGFGWLTADGELCSLDARTSIHLDAITSTLQTISSEYGQLPAPVSALLRRQRLVPLLCELLHCAKGPLCEITYRLMPIFSRVLRLIQLMAETSSDLRQQVQEPQRCVSTSKDLPPLDAILHQLWRQADVFVTAFCPVMATLGPAAGALQDRMRSVYALVVTAAASLRAADVAVHAALYHAAAKAPACALGMPRGGSVFKLSPGWLCSVDGAQEEHPDSPFAPTIDSQRLEGVSGNMIYWLRQRRRLTMSPTAPALLDLGGYQAPVVEAAVRWVACKAEGVHGEIPTAHDLSYLLGMPRQRLYDLEWLLCDLVNWDLYRAPPRSE